MQINTYTISNKRKRPKKLRKPESLRKSRKYKRFRADVLERDGHKCRSCGTDQNLTVHHKRKLKGNEGLAYETKNGITLCRECHDLKHHIEHKAAN